jgi:hypothetical protein
MPLTPSRSLAIALAALTVPAVLAATVPPLATAAPAAATSARLPAAPAAAHRVVTGNGRLSWRATARLDRRPLTKGTAPAPHAKPRRLVDCSTLPATSVQTGEGVLSLTMSAPHTSWASATDTSVVVSAWVGTGKHRSRPQQIVLYDGSEPFTYQVYLGALRTGPHCVTVKVDPAISSDQRKPAVTIWSGKLSVVPVGSPDYLALTHAPVMYGRTTSSSNDAQILTDFTATKAGRDTALSYTVIWTRERVGDGQFPAYEWGRFGRMTDVETVLDEKVAPNGKILTATYLSCGCETDPNYPDSQNAPPGPTTETQVAYPASGTPKALGHHLVLRDATGNNDESPYGTTSYRMQMVPVSGPASGQLREIVMDRHPWTYRLSNEDVSRTSTINTDPTSTSPGVYPQYLVVDIDADVTGTQSVSVGVQLSGDPTWWTNDYQQSSSPLTALALYNGGHGRTVIKLPTDWHSQQITALRLQLHSASGQTASLQGTPAIQLIEVTNGFGIVHRPVPTPTVVAS